MIFRQSTYRNLFLNQSPKTGSVRYKSAKIRLLRKFHKFVNHKLVKFRIYYAFASVLSIITALIVPLLIKVHAKLKSVS